ncbi:unnamed protein product [Gongylonema pulchrum]|uniref:C-SKI_SMAD_bind domain-containing protein n=1 Tax=Gongylonema pulchrum TaxID=637853 RepID=A0A183DK34_9BILA|nr:unnamed protein product [Gongylonema pulchrum]
MALAAVCSTSAAGTAADVQRGREVQRGHEVPRESRGESAGDVLGDDMLLEELSRRFQGVLPIQPGPTLLASDQTPCTLKSTLLGGHLIYCFPVGGECRLCFPQIISVVLGGVASVTDVNSLFTELNIHISVASRQQLDILKMAGVMPLSADSCGLVTKSDAERLVAKLLPQTSGPLRNGMSREGAVTVFHECFGGCSGLLLPALSPGECIECEQCKCVFSGEKFVSHSHSTNEVRGVCHWGFDSSNWRCYLHLDEAHELDPVASRALELLKCPEVRLGKRSADCTLDKVRNMHLLPRPLPAMRPCLQARRLRMAGRVSWPTE